MLLVVITTTTAGALMHRSKPKYGRPLSQDVRSYRQMESEYGLPPLRLHDFDIGVEALNIESVDSENGKCSDLDMNLVTVVVRCGLVMIGGIGVLILLVAAEVGL